MWSHTSQHVLFFHFRPVWGPRAGLQKPVFFYFFKLCFYDVTRCENSAPSPQCPPCVRLAIRKVIWVFGVAHNAFFDLWVDVWTHMSKDMKCRKCDVTKYLLWRCRHRGFVAGAISSGCANFGLNWWYFCTFVKVKSNYCLQHPEFQAINMGAEVLRNPEMDRWASEWEKRYMWVVGCWFRGCWIYFQLSLLALSVSVVILWVLISPDCILVCCEVWLCVYEMTKVTELAFSVGRYSSYLSVFGATRCAWTFDFSSLWSSGNVLLVLRGTL